jgi:hypothetical protein
VSALEGPKSSQGRGGDEFFQPGRPSQAGLFQVKPPGFEVFKEALDLPACGILSKHFFWREVPILVDDSDQLLSKVPMISDFQIF